MYIHKQTFYSSVPTRRNIHVFEINDTDPYTWTHDANSHETLPHKTGSPCVITVTSCWAQWLLKSPASRLFTQPFVHAHIKENIKAPRHWPVRGIHRSPVNSPHKGPVTRKMFPFDDVIVWTVCELIIQSCKDTCHSHEKIMIRLGYTLTYVTIAELPWQVQILTWLYW